MYKLIFPFPIAHAKSHCLFCIPTDSPWKYDFILPLLKWSSPLIGEHSLMTSSFDSQAIVPQQDISRLQFGFLFFFLAQEHIEFAKAVRWGLFRPIKKASTHTLTEIVLLKWMLIWWHKDTAGTARREHCVTFQQRAHTERALSTSPV